jgi:hypothetical protein
MLGTYPNGAWSALIIEGSSGWGRDQVGADVPLS